MKIIVTISLVLAVLLSSAAYAKPKKQSAAEQKKAAADSNKPVAGPNTPAVEPNTAPAAGKIEGKDVNDTAVVTVNGKAVTEGQVAAILNPRMEQVAGRVPPNMISEYRQQIRKRVVEQLVIDALLTEKEKQAGIDVNQTEMDERVNKQIAKQNLTLDEFKALLKAYGTSFADYQANVRRGIMFEKLMAGEFAQKLQKGTDEQAKAFYTENIQQFSKPEELHAKHILIKPAEDTNDQAKANAQAKAKAQEILDKIKAGENFEELAKKYSACPSAKDGGDLGTQPKGTFVPEFEKAALALKPGQVSDVVQTSFGYHIIKLIEHTDANTTSFEQAKDQIMDALADKQKEQIIMDYIQKIKGQADIKYVNEADKLEAPVEGAKPPVTRRPPETTKSSDVNSPKKD